MKDSLHSSRDEDRSFEAPVNEDSDKELGEWRPITRGAAQVLETESWNTVPPMFSDLVQSQRPLLMEVTCEKEGVLSSAVRQALRDESSAVSCTLWETRDLGKAEGVRLVLEQIETWKPGLVWLRPPGTAYSRMHRTNQRTEEQKQELRNQRQEALRTYVGCSVIWHHCVQHGMHVVWEMGDKSDAWRLPLIQNMIKRYDPFFSVTQGCQVNLRDSGGKLVKKGWKVMTTHPRLAGLLKKPCRCEPKYVHGRCEGSRHESEAPYTKEYQRLVAEGARQELSMYGVQQEAQGKTQNPDLFGCGAACMCEVTCQSGYQQTCACCVLETEETESGENHVLFGQAQNPNEAEQQAQSNLKRKDTTYETMEAFLKSIQLKLPKKGRGFMGGTQARPPYFQFGAYTHGPFSGVSKRTRQQMIMCQYVNYFLRKHAGPRATWTSFVVSYNNEVPWHRDTHNLKGSWNYTTGFGPYQGGDLALQEPGMEEIQQVNTKHEVVKFSPDAWHTVCPWTGERITISAYTVRGVGEISAAEQEFLRTCGFPIPVLNSILPSNSPHSSSPPSSEAYALEGPRHPQEKRKAQMNKQLYLLHAATGHGSLRHPVDALKKRGASEEVLQAAKEFRCSICEEKRRVEPRHLASLEPLPPKWHTLSADVGHWHHPTTGEDVQFLVMIDENTRFRTARILTRGSKQQPSATQCPNYMQEGWFQYFGLPRTLRLDPAGAFRSHALEAFCDKHSIFLDVAPAEAHWKIGSIEQAVQGIKEVLGKLHEDDPTISSEEALAGAVRVFNHLEQVRGFTPAQLALGRNADETDRLVAVSHRLPPDLLVENATGEFHRDVQRRAAAEKAHSEWHARQRLLRAQHSRPQRVYDYVPGELVFFWRSQESNKSRRSPGGKHGRFLGPARILATETRRDDDGHLRPGSSVWCISGKQLIKCCPEQLRRASEREALVEELSTDVKVPWTFTKVAEELGGNQFQDVSQEAPDEAEWQRAQDSGEERPPPLRRLRGKRPEPPPATDEMEEDHLTPLQRPRHSANNAEIYVAEKWQDKVTNYAWKAEPVEFWIHEDTAVEIEVEVPDSARGRKQMCQNFEGFFIGAMKRKAVEVSEKRLLPADKGSVSRSEGHRGEELHRGRSLQKPPTTSPAIS